VADAPQEVQDAVASHGEDILVEVAEAAVAITFVEAVKLGYTILRVAVNSSSAPSPSPAAAS
jgi:hypothetical protein